MRRSRWTPSIVPNDRESNVLVDYSETADRGRFNDPIPTAHFQTLDRWPEEDASAVQGRSDIALSVGVAFTLALPMLIGMVVYIVTLVLLRGS